jgi:PIN domain nuclease of toxin-antitoxin system
LKLLLDTHVLLWLRTEPERLTPSLLDTLSDPAHSVYVSTASAWEIAIKQSNGKLNLPDLAELWLPHALAESDIEPLSISLDDALAVRALPYLHRDPFDRLLIAQARRRGMTLVTADSQIARYDVDLLRV